MARFNEKKFSAFIAAVTEVQNRVEKGETHGAAVEKASRKFGVDYRALLEFFRE